VTLAQAGAAFLVSLPWRGTDGRTARGGGAGASACTRKAGAGLLPGRRYHYLHFSSARYHQRGLFAGGWLVYKRTVWRSPRHLGNVRGVGWRHLLNLGIVRLKTYRARDGWDAAWTAHKDAWRLCAADMACIFATSSASYLPVSVRAAYWRWPLFLFETCILQADTGCGRCSVVSQTSDFGVL